jgi:hypothetical protein
MALFDPRTLAHQVCSTWEHFPLLKIHPRPAPDRLAQILECAYLASMESEEGRALKFGLILWPRSEADESEFRIARFTERRPLSTSEIRRLAPATGLSSTFIAVESTDSGPFIWGTVDMGSEWALVQSAEETWGVGLPFLLVITVSAPGTISLKFSDSLLFSVERGQPAQQSCNVLKFGPVHEFFRPVMQMLLKEAFPNRDDVISDTHFFFSYGGEYLRFLARTLKYAEELGHGGTIIVLRGEEGDVGDLLSVKYPISSFQMWDELVRYVRVIYEEIESSKLIDGKPQVERELLDQWRTASRERGKLSHRLIDRSRFLARLTQVDGALVVTERVRVVGFGAIIRDLSETQPSFQFCQDELCRRFVKLKSEAYGTRHRSAIGLCQRLDCLAFVMSQDGGVKALRCQEGEVLLWPSVLLSPTAWFATSVDVIPQLREQYLNREL